MAKLRVHAFSISVDGFVAGRDQSIDNPLGVRRRAAYVGIRGLVSAPAVTHVHVAKTAT